MNIVQTDTYSMYGSLTNYGILCCKSFDIHKLQESGLVKTAALSQLVVQKKLCSLTKLRQVRYMSGASSATGKTNKVSCGELHAVSLLLLSEYITSI